jgi:YlmC/YmxH family sporulation protein
MEATFLELKAKQVINTVDGKCLGHITDIVFDVVCAKALGFVVPQPNQGFWGMFKGAREIFIPFECVCKIGVDVILVELYINEYEHRDKRNPNDSGKNRCVTQNVETNNKK